MKKILAGFGLIFVLAAVSGCMSEPAVSPMRADRGLPPKILLDVQAINLADRSGMQPTNSPYNSNHFSPTISEAVKQWASDRLQAAGPSGQAIIIIKDASLIAQPLPITQGIDGWFTRQQGVKYIGRAEVTIEANGSPGYAVTDAVATRAVTLPENPTATEKQDAYYALLNGLMKDLGQNLESGIAMHMSRLIVAPQTYGVTSVPTGGIGGGNMMGGAGDFAPVVIASPPTTTISQSSLLPAPTGSTGATQAEPPTPQAPVFGSRSVATVPDLASTPGSFPPQANNAPTPLAQVTPPPMPAQQPPMPMPEQAQAPAPFSGNYGGYPPPAMPAPPQPPSPPMADQPRGASATIPLSGPGVISGYGQ